MSYDKAIKINSQKLYNDQAGAQKVANLTTAESKLEVAGVFRYPLGKGANAPVVGGKLAYEKKTFTIGQALPSDADPSQSVDVPNVDYTILSPQAFIIFRRPRRSCSMRCSRSTRSRTPATSRSRPSTARRR